MQVQIRAVVVQAAPDGTVQGASVTFDATLPDGTTHQFQRDVTPWAMAHQAALNGFLAEAAARIATMFGG